MSYIDITRNIHQPAKKYSGVVRLQGAVITDSDENDSQAIQKTAQRQTVHDVIGVNGSSDNGFKVLSIVNPSTVAGKYDLNLSHGTFYIGGMRLEADQDFTLAGQDSWLQSDSELILPDIDITPGTQKTLVFLKAWEQNISGREDSELLEVALGGALSSARSVIRPRVDTFATTADNCRTAFDELIASLESSEAAFDLATGALRGTTKMEIMFDDEADSAGDLCTPRRSSGYLGADNELILVRVTAPNRFVWSFAGAGQIYRVKAAAASGDTNTITMLTPPWDQISQPKPGDVVEFLHWSGKLPNDEKIAEMTGVLARVSRSYNAADMTFEIEKQEALLQPMRDWLSGAVGTAHKNPHDEDPALSEYLFMRIYKGPDVAPMAVDLVMDNTHGVPLPGTGLRVKFDGPGRAGDYYQFSVRPNSPHRIIPWEYQKAGGWWPTGPVHYYATLGFIDWSIPDGDGNYPNIVDCRKKFRPLSRTTSCCEVTVGDGVESHGDFLSIAEAIEALPSEGGKICLLPGHFTENVRLSGKDNITISGCGFKTVWTARRLADIDVTTEVEACLLIENCHQITLQDFTMTGQDFECVKIGGEVAATDMTANTHIKLHNIHFIAHQKSALWLNGCSHLTLSDSHVEALELEVRKSDIAEFGDPYAVFVLGHHIKITGNKFMGSSEGDAYLRSNGGLQIAGGSRYVTINDNIVDGGAGHGIVLGHVEIIDEFTGIGGGTMVSGTWSYVDENGCLKEGEWGGWIPGGPVSTQYPISGGTVEDIDICGNEILRMGRSGISVAYYFDLNEDPDYIALERVSICNNLIEDCLRNEVFNIPLEQLVFKSYACIALAAIDDLNLSQNIIRNNGKTITAQNSGVFIIYGTSLVFRENRIFENGAKPQEATNISGGRRGGISIAFCSTSARTEEITGAATGAAVTDVNARSFVARHPALICDGNFVDSSHGEALKVMAFGPVQVSNNRLNGSGAPNILGALILFGISEIPIGPPLIALVGTLLAFFSDPDDAGSEDLQFGAEVILSLLGGQAVSVVNLGIMEEIPGLLSFFANDDPALQALSVGGETAIVNNQISLYSPDTTFNFYTSAVLAISYDDVMIADNHIECESSLGFIPINTMAIGMTVRVTGNRFQERYFPALQLSDKFALQMTLFSAWTFGLILNTTANNQGTHCFFPVAPFSAGNKSGNNSSVMDIASIAWQQILPDSSLQLARCENYKETLQSLWGDFDYKTMFGFLGGRNDGTSNET